MALLGGAREADGFFRGGEQGLGLVDRLLILGLGTPSAHRRPYPRHEASSFVCLISGSPGTSKAGKGLTQSPTRLCDEGPRADTVGLALMNTVIPTLVLLVVANGTPVIVKRLFGTRADHAIDGGARFADGRFIFGPSKTIRGIVSSVIATALAAPIVGFTFLAGVVIALGAMAGDLASSFIKRRLGLEPSAKATGLDQIPEALLPCPFLSAVLPLTAADVAIIVLLFFGAELVLSELLFRAGVRNRSY